MDSDVRKVIELVCSGLPAHTQKEEHDWESVTLTDEDFKRQGMSFDFGVSVLKHKVSEYYPVLEVGTIHIADPESTANEEEWGHPYISMYAHPILISELLDAKGKEALDFTFSNCALSIKGKSIAFGTPDSKENGCYVLEHIFSHDRKEVSFYSEIHVETMGERKETFTGKRYYDACGVIQKRIAKDVGIGDFLVFNSGERGFVKINPKYIP